MKAVCALFLFALAATSWCIGATAGPYRVNVVTEPAVVPVGRATLVVTVTDSSGKPIAGAQVHGIAQMPGMPMGERTQPGTPGDRAGTYRIPVSFAMAGGYEAKVDITGPLGSATATLPLETGQSTATGAKGGIPWPAIGSLALGAAIVFFVIVRIRRTEQSVDLRPIFTRSVLVPLGAVGLVVWGAVYVVGHFRRPGAMTPIQAQVMDMDAPPPEGVIPVTLATAEVRPFNPVVKYTGQAVGYVEQDVYPRVTGTIVWAPYYVGDRVKAGQVLARLDTSQLRPLVDERTADVRSAEGAVNSAKADYKQALAGIGEAEAEHGRHEAMAEEMEANVKAAQESLDSFRSQATEARSQIAAAKARLSSAQADASYWQAELKREASLFASGAVSTAEYQQEKDEAERSVADLQSASQGLAGARAKLRGAQAQTRQAVALAGAAQKRLVESQSELLEHHQHVQMAKASADSAKSRIVQAAANLAAARAELEGATATAGYATIRAETDGVVTQRLISPGVLVSPGQAILRVAEIQPIRVQANVAESDLSRIHMGATVQVRHGDSGEAPTLARVSSVSPSLDPVARTGVVEAVLPNADRSFLPGEFVSMDISVAATRANLVIPASAVQTRVRPSDSDVVSTDEQRFVWVATPLAGEPNRFTVSQANVQIEAASGDLVAIESGIAAGTRVATSSVEYLKPGDSVEAAPAEVDANLTVKITAQGFVPASASIPEGAPATITFIRGTDDTCAKAVVFPSFKLTKQLPLNVPVKVALPPQLRGEIDYRCGMNMLHGKVVVR